MDTPDQTPAEQAADRADEVLARFRQGTEEHARNVNPGLPITATTVALFAQAEQTRALRLAVVEAGLRIGRAIERNHR